MERGTTGNYETSVAAGETCRAFVPAPLPPTPALAVDAGLQERLDEAHLALGRLDSITVLLPETSVFLYSYVRKEAVMSSQIEGTQSSLSDLMLYEAEGAPGVPLDDVREVSCYVAALEHGLGLLKGGPKSPSGSSPRSKLVSAETRPADSERRPRRPRAGYEMEIAGRHESERH